MPNSFTQAIQIATAKVMKDERVHVLGLGANYPNGLDGTMGDLAKLYPARVHDTPCSENAVTGMAVGMAISGLRPIVHHGRIEFALHAADQLLTQSSKWNYMFGGDYEVPITVRIALGRQWGNGPQHTFTGKTMFSVPGMRVVCPSTPDMARSLLISSVYTDKPVIYLEPRWLYKTQETLTDEVFPIDKARIVRSGRDLTLVAVGDAVIDALKAAAALSPKISVEVIDLVSVYPIDMDTIYKSVNRTGRLFVFDIATPAYTVGHQILSGINRMCNRMCNLLPKRQGLITCPDTACPTAPSLTKNYYPTWQNVAIILKNSLGLGTELANERDMEPTFEQLNLPPTDNFDNLKGV